MELFAFPQLYPLYFPSLESLLSHLHPTYLLTGYSSFCVQFKSCHLPGTYRDFPLASLYFVLPSQHPSFYFVTFIGLISSSLTLWLFACLCFFTRFLTFLSIGNVLTVPCILQVVWCKFVKLNANGGRKVLIPQSEIIICYLLRMETKIGSVYYFMEHLISIIKWIVGKQFGITIIVVPKIIKQKVKNCLSSHNLEITSIKILVNVSPDFFSRCIYTKHLSIYIFFLENGTQYTYSFKPFLINY